MPIFLVSKYIQSQSCAGDEKHQKIGGMVSHRWDGINYPQA